MPKPRQIPAQISDRKVALAQARRLAADWAHLAAKSVEWLEEKAKLSAHLALEGPDVEPQQRALVDSIDAALEALPQQAFVVQPELEALRAELGFVHGLGVDTGSGKRVQLGAAQDRLLQMRRELLQLRELVVPLNPAPRGGRPPTKEAVFAADLLSTLEREKVATPLVVVIGLLAIAFGVGEPGGDVDEVAERWKKFVAQGRALLKAEKKRQSGGPSAEVESRQTPRTRRRT